MKDFYLKIFLPAILAILLFVLTIFMIIIPRYRHSIMDGKREMIKELTNSALSILSKYENDEQEGLIGRDEAQKTAISRIQYLRYGDENKDYFWVTDLGPRMVVHPFRPDLNGKELGNFTDPHGKKMFVEFVSTVKKSNEGYVDYMWQWKDDSLHIVPKLSYVKLFEPWQWVIGTGIYIEDVEDQINRLTKRLLTLSIAITALIAILMFYLAKQSLNMERKRQQAENKLKESKDRYRTLVEAATEGLLMLVDGKISYANKLMNKLTGYPPEQITELKFSDLISKNNNTDTINALSGTKVKDGNYEVNLITSTGFTEDVLIISSTTTFYGSDVNVFIIKKISESNQVGLSNIEFQKLIGTLNVGFFKVILDANPRFVYANETALRILGFSDIKSLEKHSLPQLIEDESGRNDIVDELNTNGFLKNRIVQISGNHQKQVFVNLSIVVLSPEEMICDGIIEDVTNQEIEKNAARELIATLKSTDLLFEQPVSSYAAKIVVAPLSIPISKVIELMDRKSSAFVLLTNNENEHIGIVTRQDIQSRVFSLGLHLDNPSYLIMSAPLTNIGLQASVRDAVAICIRKEVGHLLVADQLGKAVSVFSVSKIKQSLLQNKNILIDGIAQSESILTLAKFSKKASLLAHSMVKGGIDVAYITRFTASVSDAIIGRLIKNAIIDLGEAPTKFAFICLGSEGRGEETLLTDQDNALIYEDVPERDEPKVKAYFTELAEMVCKQLNELGYAYCKGNIMAQNPRWCSSLAAWTRNYLEWISTPEAQNLLEATIFFDFRFVYGEENLTDKLRSNLIAAIQHTPSFFYHLAHTAANVRVPQISSGSVLSDKGNESIDLKAAVAPIVMMARAYALKNNYWESNTLSRLKYLDEQQLVSHYTLAEAVYSFNTLMRLRFRTQLAAIETNGTLTNYLLVKTITDIELNMLKKVLGSIHDFQNRLRQDFRIMT